MKAKPDTHQLEKTYQPNIVLNQCVSIDNTQSQADIEDDTAKNTKNQAAELRIFFHRVVPAG